MPLEMVISRRMSMRNYDLDTMVPSELVSKVLWAAYGYSWRGRTIPSFSGARAQQTTQQLLTAQT